MSAVPGRRIASLARCANVSRWFRYPATPTPGHYLSFITDADLDLLTQLGFGAVRLTIGADQLIRKDQEDAPVEETLSCLKLAVRRLVDRRLMVMLTMYGVSDRVESPFRAPAFVRFWSRLARELRDTDPDAVVFEPVNEPIFSLLPRRWRGVEEKLVAGIRAEAPDHTIATSGPNWSGLDALLAHRPLADPNVIYTFHFYEPYLFTHQGAPWNSGWVTEVRDVPYPLTRAAVASRLDPSTRHHAAILREAEGGFDRSYIERRIGLAAEWGRRHGVAVWCGEFGCFPRVAPHDCVLEWFRDVRTAFERHGVGWAVWSYDEELGLDRKLVDGRPVIDQGVAASLGLRPTLIKPPLT